MPKLNAASIKSSADGNLSDVGGLILRKSGDKGRWFYRFQFKGRRRDMSLGRWPGTSLSDARKIRDRWAVVLAEGRDPLDVRRAEEVAQSARADRDDPQISQLVDIVFDAKKESLRGDGTRGRWRSPIDTHVIPKIGKIRGSEITRHHIYDTLKPIWRTKHPTALKALRRIRMILQSAARMDFPVKPQVVDSAEEMLGHHDHQVTRIRAVDWRDIPDTFQKLPDTTGGRAITWLMLTLVRMDAGIKARVEEVDLEAGIWTVPADRIKGRKGKVQDFRVPLPEQCLVMAREAILVGSEFIFPGQRRGSPITNVGVEKVLKTIEVPGTPHGFRTSFRTWVQDTDACSFEVAETVLGHAIGGNVERAYARSDLLDRRRPVMEAWAKFVTTDEVVVAPDTSS